MGNHSHLALVCEGEDADPSLVPRLRAYRGVVLDAAKHGHAVVEWVVKY
ncbi:hypothetical protein BH09MYX1_BH09MYX1_10660 [soil metagenome]